MQNHAAALTRALDRRGVAQTVVTACRVGAPVRERLGEHADVVRVGIRVSRFRQFYSVPAAALALDPASPVDLVHVHVGEDVAALPIALVAARSRGVPLVVTLHTSVRHTLSAVDLRSRLLKLVAGRIEKWGIGAADAVIALTPRLARLLVAAGLDAERVFVIPSGVERHLFANHHEDPFPGAGRLRVLFLGRLARQKGADVLVAAAKLLVAPGVQVLLVGDGPERGRIERAVRRLGVADRVRLLGFVPHERVPAVLAHADVLAVPSRYEDLGSVLVEAMYARLPVVASRTGGIPDVLAEGATGLLVPPEDPEALAAALDRLLRDRALAARLAERGRERADDYDWERLAEQVLAVYERVLATRPGYAHARVDRRRVLFGP